MSEYLLGDQVRLKSGGPVMTVEDIGEYSAMGIGGGRQKAKCTWFDDKHKLQSEVFELHVLQKYEPPSVRTGVVRRM